MSILILGVDPSLTACGLAAVDLEAGKVLAWKCIRTEPDAKFKATEDLARRLREVAGEVKAFCAEYKGVPAIEGQMGSSFGKMSSMSTVGMLMAAYGAVLASLPTKPIVIHPSTVKSRLIGQAETKRTGKEAKEAAWAAARVYFTSFPPEPSTKVAREAVHDAVVMCVAALPEIQQLEAMMPPQ